MTPLEILALPMDPDSNDAGATSVRQYLVELLAELWKSGEGFSGKRPFGNSGWSHELMIPLVRAGAITGSFDEDGYLDECDTHAGDLVITDAIQAMVAPVTRGEMLAEATAAEHAATELDARAAQLRESAAALRSMAGGAS